MPKWSSAAPSDARSFCCSVQVVPERTNTYAEPASTPPGVSSGRPDHHRVPGDRHRVAEVGARQADGVAVPEELGLVDERGIHGDREASGLRLDDEPDLPVHRLDAEPPAGGRPRPRPRGRRSGRASRRNRRANEAPSPRADTSRSPWTAIATTSGSARRGSRLLELEPLLEPAGPVDVPLGHGPAAVLHPFLLGLRLRGLQRAHVALVAVARHRDAQPPRCPRRSLRDDLDPLAPERRPVAPAAGSGPGGPAPHRASPPGSRGTRIPGSSAGSGPSRRASGRREARRPRPGLRPQGHPHPKPDAARVERPGAARRRAGTAECSARNASPLVGGSPCRSPHPLRRQFRQNRITASSG